MSHHFADARHSIDMGMRLAEHVPPGAAASSIRRGIQLLQEGVRSAALGRVSDASRAHLAALDERELGDLPADARTDWCSGHSGCLRYLPDGD